MKRKWTILPLCLLLVIGLAACGGETEPEAAETLSSGDLGSNPTEEPTSPIDPIVLLMDYLNQNEEPDDSERSQELFQYLLDDPEGFFMAYTVIVGRNSYADGSYEPIMTKISSGIVARRAAGDSSYAEALLNLDTEGFDDDELAAYTELTGQLDQS